MLSLPLENFWIKNLKQLKPYRLIKSSIKSLACSFQWSTTTSAPHSIMVKELDVLFIYLMSNTKLTTKYANLN